MLLAASLALSLQPYLVASHSDLNWNIAQDLSGTASPNVLSELEFEKIRGYQAGLAASVSGEFFHPDIQLFFEGEGSSGRISRGIATDTDYMGDDRLNIGSRSESKVRGDEQRNYSAGVGLSYDLVPQQHALSLIAGAYFQNEDINIREGRQLIAAPGFFPLSSLDALTHTLGGLNSNYLSEWSGYWVAGQYRFSWQDWALSVRYQQYRGEYYGEGRWNLRAEGSSALQQPKSFSHRADSSGASWQLGLEYELNTQLDLHLTWSTGEWDAKEGTATVYFADGTLGRTRLNQAERQASEIRVGLSYTFE